ncbi:hypothetical protein [Marivirga sp.]|uniref:hypothetical protein n=1 Tax=Marivirga sp. TaxID=2018662 RepID=UPI0025ECF767|nr:hypothetical protein [Marivirga sp.]
MKVQKIKLSPHDFSWLVLDDNHLPIKPITEFIRYLNNVDKSPCRGSDPINFGIPH